MRKLKRIVKRAVAPVIIATSLSGVCASAVGGGIALFPTSVFADTVSTGDFSSTLTEAKKTDGLTVNTTKKTVTVSSAAEAQGLIDIETVKLREAINTQKANNLDYDNKMSDPDFLLQTYPSQYSKEDIISFLTTKNGTFDYKNVNVLNLGAAKEAVFSNGLTNRTRGYMSSDTDNKKQYYKVVNGDYILYKQLFKDKKTGKWVDVKLTFKDIVEAKIDKSKVTSTCFCWGQIYYAGDNERVRTTDLNRYEPLVILDESGANFQLAGTLSGINHGSLGNYHNLLTSDSPEPGFTCHFDFFESGTTTPISVDLISRVYDLDWFNHEDFVDGTGDLAIFQEKMTYSDTNVKFLQTSNPTSSLVVKNNMIRGNVSNVATDSDNPRVQQVTKTGAAINRNVSSTDIRWEGGYFHFNNINLGFTEPTLKTTTVNAIEYTFKQKASYNYIDSTGNQLSTPTNLTGETNTNISTTDVTNKINILKNKGWDTTYKVTAEKFDNDLDFDQNHNIVFTPHIETIQPTDPKKKGDPTDRTEVTYPSGVDEKDLKKDVTRTIKYVYEDGSKAKDSIVQSVTLTRTATFNYVTGEVIYSDWTTGSMAEVKSPVIENYTYDKSVVQSLNVNSGISNSTVTVTYRKIPQKGSVSFKDEQGNSLADKKELNGYQAEAFGYNPNSTISNLENKGWDVVSNDFPYDNAVYDKDSNVDQDFNVIFTPHIEIIKSDKPKAEGSDTDRSEVKYPSGLAKNDLNKTIARTIKYQYEDGSEAFPSVVQKVTLMRDGYFNYVTGEVTYGNWTTGEFTKVDSPVKENYKADKLTVDNMAVKSDTGNLEVIVVYKKIPQKGSVTFKDMDDKEVAPKVILDGYQMEEFGYSPKDTLETLKSKGYDVSDDNFPYDNPVFDTDTTRDQDYIIILKPVIETIKPDDSKTEGSDTDRSAVKYPKGVDEADLNKTITRTIKYIDGGGSEIEPVVQTTTLTREAYFNYVTGEVTYSDWTTDVFSEVKTAELANRTWDIDKVDTLKVTSETGDSEVVVTYKKIPQKAIVRFVSGGKEIAESVTLDGFNEEKIDYDPADAIKALESKGYDLIDNKYPDEAGRVFDTDSNTDQEFIISFEEHKEKITSENAKNKGDATDRSEVKYSEGLTENDLSKTVKRIIRYQYVDGTIAFESKIQEVTITREAEFNYVTGEVVYSEWSEAKVESVESPKLEGFTVDKEKIDEAVLEEDTEEVVTYTAEEKPAKTTECKTDDNSKECKTEEVDNREGKYSDTPKTGDRAPFTVLISVMGGALATIFTAIGIRRKRSKN